ncbi:cytochrome P450 [Geopyxis carbonaria]|nr:cytochrome P450 [Geopyxis carbonaria]
MEIEDILSLPSIYLSSSTTLSLLRDLSIFAVVSILLAITRYVVYNLYFHPLRSFPGPFLARSSKVYIILAIYRGQEHLADEALHNKYGPLVRKGPNLLLFKDASLLPVFYHRYADKTSHYEYLRYFGFLGIQPHTAHSEARKKVAAPFANSAVMKMEGAVATRVDEWVETMGREFADTGRKLDFAYWASYYAYDVISELCFGRPFGFIKAGNDFYGLADGFKDHIFWQGLFVRLPSVVRALRGTRFQRFLDPTSKDGKGLGCVIVIRDELIKDRLENPQLGGTDILSHLLAAYNTGSLTMNQLKNDLLIFMVAGSDTAAITLRTLLIQILTHPRVHATLQAQSAGDYAYLDACLRETLRHTPAAPDGFPRLVSKGGADLPAPYNIHVPAGTEIMANSYCNNRDPAVFSEYCDEYRPERWLEGGPEGTERMERGMNTFGYGSRVCIGKSIAELELRVATRRFFDEFEPTLVNPEKPCEGSDNYGLLHHHGLWITLERRKL